MTASASAKTTSPSLDKAAVIREMVASLPLKKQTYSHHVVLQAEHLSKSFLVGDKQIPVLQSVSFKIYSSEFAIIYGPSGCGKSTLLHTLLGLEPPTHGKVILRDKDIYHMKEDARTMYRRDKIGMVFQQPNWIKSLKVWENVAYPLYLTDTPVKKAKMKALERLEEVGLSQYANYSPLELSGGQQQKVALARAMVTNPWIIIADEPTGNLDTQSSAEIMKIFCLMNRNDRKLILLVTHDIEYLPIATHRLSMLDGRIVKDERE